MQLEELFDEIDQFPDHKTLGQFRSLVGLDETKERLVKEAGLLLFPELLTKWSQRFHNGELSGVLAYFLNRPHLFVLAGDVGTGKTALARSLGAEVAAEYKCEMKLFPMSLNARGRGAVGEMTRLLSTAFEVVRNEASKNISRKEKRGYVLLIDEADALAQSRELAQMHHEDRAGVNALLRGIDRIAEENLPILVIMCTNRLSALDPAVRRRAAGVFEFHRPNEEQRSHVLQTGFANLGFSPEEIAEIVTVTGVAPGFTYSDFTQRYFPAVILAAFPDKPVDFELAFRIARSISPTAPFNSES